MSLASLILLFLAFYSLNAFGFHSYEFVIWSKLLYILLIYQFSCFFIDFCSVSLTEQIWYGPLINLVRDDFNFLEFSYSYFASFWSSWIAISPNLSERDNRVQSLSEHKFPPVIAGIMLKKTTSSNRFNDGIVPIKQVSFPLKPPTMQIVILIPLVWIVTLMAWFSHLLAILHMTLWMFHYQLQQTSGAFLLMLLLLYFPWKY